MSQEFPAGVAIVLTGTGATLLLDVWTLLLKRLGLPGLSMDLLGRWIGHLPRGRWFHSGIAQAAPIAGERWIGWCAHYAIGIGFAVLPFLVLGWDWLRSPSLGAALATGIATAMAPLFVLQPALGAGIASSKTRTPLRNCLKSLASHAIFGLGLYLSARAMVAAAI